MRNFLIFTILAANFEIRNALKTKPNIIIFLSDDLGSYDIGFHGSKHLSTPNMDSLAADGIILNRYYTQPLCTPSRGALLSGVHPIHSGTQNYVLLGASPWGLPLQHKLLPQYLKELGYSNHAIGKWHLGSYRKEYIPTNRGFDSHIGFWMGNEDYYNHSLVENGFEGLDFRHNLDVIRNADGIYSTDYFTESAINLISEHNVSNPLFLYMAYQSVHVANEDHELQAPKELIEKFSYIKDINRRTFVATLYSMDLSVGKIVNELNNKKLLDNSIILFLSDNGGAISGFMENNASNFPLRGTKGTLWEGSVRVPAFIWSKLLNNSGYVSDSYIQVIDWIPTLLEAIEYNYTNNIQERLDGISLWSSLDEKICVQQNDLLLNIDPIWNMSSIISDDWKLIQGSVPEWVETQNTDIWSQSYDDLNTDSNGTKHLMSERIDSIVYKLLEKLNRKPNFSIFDETIIDCRVGYKNQTNFTNCDLTENLCLFNIESDPCEYNNLVKEYPKIVQKLWQKILDNNKTAVDPLSMIPMDPNANPIYHNNTWDIWIKE